MQETESAIKTTSTRRANVCSIDFMALSSIAFAHHEVQTAEDRGDVANQATWQKLREDAEVYERRRANFHPIRPPPAGFFYKKPPPPLGISPPEIASPRRRIEPFGHYNEMMD